MRKIKNMKFAKIIFVVLMIFTISSCTPIMFNGIKLSEQVHIWDDEIMRCIKEKDKSSLANLFCDKVKNTDYLNKKIDFFFDYIEKQGGIFIDDTGKWHDGGGHGAYSGGRRVIKYDGRQYDKAVFIGDKEYIFSYGGYITLLKHKEYEGITHISFREKCDLLKAPIEKRNIALNDKSAGHYLGIGIFNKNYETYLDENVAPKEIYENEEYRFDSDKLEKGHSKW